MFCRSELLFDFLSTGRISNAVQDVESLDATNLPRPQCLWFTLQDSVLQMGALKLSDSTLKYLLV